MARDRLKDKLCQALDRAERTLGFYADASRVCNEDLGRDVYNMLRNEEQEYIERIHAIQRELSGGEPLDKACTLPADDPEPGKEVFRRMASRFGRGGKPCTSAMEAINVALDLENANLRFYEEWLREAEEEGERRFVGRMADEERGHYHILSDMFYYYEDPETWAEAAESSDLGAMTRNKGG